MKNAYVEFVIEQFAPLGEISARSAFGGHTLYCNGVTFAIIADGALYLKTDDGNRAAFEARRLIAFQPFPDKPGVMSYYQAPPEIFEDPDALREWGEASLAAGRRAQAKKSHTAKSRKSAKA